MNPTGKGGFGDHKEHIKRTGSKRKNFEDVRALAQKIANEPIKNGEMTVIEAILRTWAQSKEPQLQKAFVEYAYGKVPDVINGDQEGGPIRIKVTGKKTDEGL